MKIKENLYRFKWLAAIAAISLCLTSPTGAAPFRDTAPPRAMGRSDVVKVDHRSYPGRDWRWHHDGRPRVWHGHGRRHHAHDHGPAYGHYPARAYDWLAFTAITVKLLDVMADSQRHAYEAARVRATTGPVGETVYWNRDDARGTITAVRDGTSSAGRYCREFQQTVTVGGRTESGYGTACRQPDGSWAILP